MAKARYLAWVVSASPLLLCTTALLHYGWPVIAEREIIAAKFELIEPGNRYDQSPYSSLTQRISRWIGYGIADPGVLLLGAIVLLHLLKPIDHMLFRLRRSNGLKFYSFSDHE